MYVPAPSKCGFFREGPIFPPSTPAHINVPLAVDVPTNGPKHVPKPVGLTVEKSKHKRGLGKSKKKLIPTRRGRGGRGNKWGDIQIHNFSIMGTNSNGLKAKKNSLVNTVNFFNGPSVLTVQETKLRQNGIIKLDGYQIFEMHRTGLGGGLLTAAKHELDPVLISQGDDQAKILVVQLKE